MQKRRKKGIHGYDAGKKINNRKRQLLVDTEGLTLAVKLTDASLHDKEGGRQLLEHIGTQQFTRLKKLWTDQGYAGLADWVDEKFGWSLEVVSRPKTEQVTITGDDGQPKEVTIKVKGFLVSPRRWVVECTFVWCSRNRRLSKEYE